MVKTSLVMKNIYIFKDGSIVPVEIKRLFNTHGPYTIEGKRLDLLTKVNLITDSSISTFKQTGSSIETSKTGSLVGRAVTGAVLAGGVGAIVGGLSGGKESVTTSTSEETIITDITIELVFNGNDFLYIQVKDMGAFHWLLGFANQSPLSDDKIETERQLAIIEQVNISFYDTYRKVISESEYSDNSNSIILEREKINILKNIYHELDKKLDINQAITLEKFIELYEPELHKRTPLTRGDDYKPDYSDKIQQINIQQLIIGFVVVGFSLYIPLSGLINNLTNNNEDRIINDSNNKLEVPIDTHLINLPTSDSLLNELNEAIKIGNLPKSEESIQKLEHNYPNSTELQQGLKLVDELKQKIEINKLNQAAEAAKKLQLLKETPNFVFGDTSIKLNKATIGNKWIFDSYDSVYHYFDAERESSFVIAGITVTSKSKTPDLFGIAAYVLEDSALWRLGYFDYRFSRWNDFGSYLGNTADYGNDFAHKSSIQFSLGVSIAEKNTNKTIYIVATKEGCNVRHYERFANPPISYERHICDSLPLVLKAEDFETGDLTVLKKFSARKKK